MEPGWAVMEALEPAEELLAGELVLDSVEELELVEGAALVVVVEPGLVVVELEPVEGPALVLVEPEPVEELVLAVVEVQEQAEELELVAERAEEPGQALEQGLTAAPE